MTAKQKQLSWKPVRRGDIFCAPACGYNCTWQMYLKAKQESVRLAKSLGAGWKPHVWENMGWYYSALSPCGRIKVHPGFCAFLGIPNEPGGRWAEHGRTAKQAVANVIRVAKRDLAKINSYIVGLQ